MINMMYPTRSRAAYPPPRFVFLLFDVETLVFWTLKWNEKSMKNGPKINQKSIKNGPKIDQKSSKIEVWRAPGQVWRPLGPSWAIQSVFGGILDRLGGVLEGSWRPLGRSWAEKGGQHGSNLAPKTEPKPIKNRSQNWSIFYCSWNRFLEGFWWILDAKMKQSWAQNGIKNRC